MSEEARRWLIAYDVTDDARRDRLARRLLEYGDRVQYSVFVIDARPAKLVRLRTAIREIMESEDSVLIAGLGPVGDLNAQRFLYMGRRSCSGSRPVIGVSAWRLSADR